MSRYLPALLPLLGLALLAVACGDGGSGDSTATPQPSAGATATIQLTETSGEQLSPTAANGEDDLNDQTPNAESTASTSTPALVVTPLASPVIPDLDVVTEQVECGFDPTSSVADCADHGTYTIDPPLIGGYTSCSLNIIQNQPALLTCTGEGNVPPIYYPLQ